MAPQMVFDCQVCFFWAGILNKLRVCHHHLKPLHHLQAQYLSIFFGLIFPMVTRPPRAFTSLASPGSSGFLRLWLSQNWREISTVDASENPVNSPVDTVSICGICKYPIFCGVSNLLGGCLGFLIRFFPSTVSKWAPITSFKEGALTLLRRLTTSSYPCFLWPLIGDHPSGLVL